MTEKKGHTMVKVALVAVSIFFGLAFFAWTIRPFLQVEMFYLNVGAISKMDNDHFVSEENFVFNPYTYVQPMLRYQFVELVLGAFKKGIIDPQGKLFGFAVKKLEEVVQTNGNFVNYYLDLGKAYDVMALTTDDPQKTREYFDKANAYFEQALEIVPDNPDLVVAYAISLSNDHQDAKEVELLTKLTNSGINIPMAHYYLGVLYYQQNPKNITPDALTEIEIALNQGANIDPELTKNVYYKLLAYYDEQRDKERLATVAARLKVLDAAQATSYQQIIDYINENGKVPVLNVTRGTSDQ